MITPTLSHSVGSGTIALDAIIIPPRIRLDTEKVRRYISEDLAPSIAEVGVLQPPVLNKHEALQTGINYLGHSIQSNFELIAGWSRLQACALLGHSTIPYCLQSGLDRRTLHIMELEENFRRNAMEWQDEVIGVHKVHTLHADTAAQKYETWTQRATGRLLKRSVGNVNECLMVAKLLVTGDKEICSATNFDAAKQIIMKRRENELTAHLVAKHSTPHTSTPVTVLPIRISLPGALSGSPLEREPEVAPSQKVRLSKMLFNEPCVFPGTLDGGWMAGRAEKSVDLIFTDIPFGIDMGKLDLVDMASVVEEHDVEENVAQMWPFLFHSYRLLKDNSYCMFFYDICHQEKLTTWARKAGFDVMPYPFVWCKTSSCKNNAAGVWWTKSIEYVMILKKGSPSLREPQKLCYMLASNDAERKKYGHPFSKPFEVCKKLLEPIILHGMTVLDPYAGRGSMVCSSLTMGCQVLAVEKQTEHFNSLTANVQDFFRLALGRKEPEFV